ncbi:MAG: SpoIIE family protein phosphatase [Planctomycetia bacterium]|nr:SpoIIE family protein phosphatase [Planctomycetia bacterium]
MSSALAFLLIKSRGLSRSKNSSSENIEKIPVYSDSVILGRHPFCNIVLDNAAVSREHTRIEHSQNGFTIEDLQSRNGTWLNNKPLIRKTFLYDNDIIRICDMIIVFTSSLPEARRPSKEESCLGSQTVIINNDSLQDLNISSQINVHDSQQSQLVGCGDYVRQITNLQNKISVLMSFAKNLGKVNKPSDLLPRFLSDLLILFPQADYACLLAPNLKTKEYEISYFQRRNPNDLTPIHISRTLLETVIKSRNGILSEEFHSDFLADSNLENNLEVSPSRKVQSQNDSDPNHLTFLEQPKIDPEKIQTLQNIKTTSLTELQISNPEIRKSRLGAPKEKTKKEKTLKKTNQENQAKSYKIRPQSLFAFSDKNAFDDSNNPHKYTINPHKYTMAVPILDISKEDDVLGVLKLDSLDFQTPFSHDDLDLLIAVANQAAVYYENSKHHEILLQETILTQEMTVAHKVQKGFLPAAPPKILNYDFFDYYRPAKYLGGDYFDYIPLPDGRLAIALGDVSGKGISAALLMAQLSSEVRYSLLLEKSYTQAMERLNRVYSENHWDNRFITFLLAVLDPQLHKIHLLNAGHVFPILSTTGGKIFEQGDGLHGFPLGIISDSQYQEFIFELRPGELITIMSDGITDAMNDQDDFFGLDRVRDCLRNPDHLTAQELGEKLLNQVRSFSKNIPQTDDQCLVVFGRK